MGIKAKEIKEWTGMVTPESELEKPLFSLPFVISQSVIIQDKELKCKLKILNTSNEESIVIEYEVDKRGNLLKGVLRDLLECCMTFINEYSCIETSGHRYHDNGGFVTIVKCGRVSLYYDEEGVLEIMIGKDNSFVVEIDNVRYSASPDGVVRELLTILNDNIVEYKNPYARNLAYAPNSNWPKNDL